MSIHGICYDEGQSGNCGIQCEGFITGQCDARDDVIEAAVLNAISNDAPVDELIEVLTDEELFEFETVYEYLADKYIGQEKRLVMKAQTKYEYNEKEYLRKLIDN